MYLMANKIPLKRLTRYLVVIGLTVLLAFGEIFEPIDLPLRSTRDMVRKQPVSGEFAIITLNIEDETIATRDLIRASEKLLSNGAEKVAFTGAVTERFIQNNDIQEHVKQFSDQFIITLPNDTTYKSSILTIVLEAVDRYDQVASEDYNTAYWDGVEVDQKTHELLGKSFPSLPIKLIGDSASGTGQYWIDYSFDIKSIPVLRTDELLQDGASQDDFSGKTILICLEAHHEREFYRILGDGKYPSAYTTVLAAETLQEGPTHFWGAWLSLVAAWMFIIISRTISRLRFRVLSAILFAIALNLIPLGLEAIHVRILIADGLLVVLFGTAYTVTRDVINRERLLKATHPLSECRTPIVWRMKEVFSEDFLVSARIEHYAEIVSEFSTGQERQLIAEILDRLNPNGDIEIIHGEDGQFFWLTAPESVEQIGHVLRGTLALFRSGLAAGDERIPVTLSFGLDIRTKIPLDVRMSGAIAAARSARDAGTDWLIHDAGNTVERKSQSTLAGDLQRALLSDELQVAFQPKYDMSRDEICGFEALARWTHKDRGPISPFEFVAAAERYGRIAHLTYYVLEKALAAHHNLRSFGFSGTLSVNLSALMFTQPGAADKILNIISESGVPFDRVILEITETSTISEADEASIFFDKLIKAGVGLSIDDYGTGASTLEQLKTIPAKELKIDRAFVIDILKNPATPIMLRSTIQLAHALGMVTVIEGIEDAATLDFIKDIGGDVAQGYYIAKPMMESEVVDFLVNKNWSHVYRTKRQEIRSA